MRKISRRTAGNITFKLSIPIYMKNYHYLIQKNRFTYPRSLLDLIKGIGIGIFINLHYNILKQRNSANRAQISAKFPNGVTITPEYTLHFDFIYDKRI